MVLKLREVMVSYLEMIAYVKGVSLLVVSSRLTKTGQLELVRHQKTQRSINMYKRQKITRD